MNKLIKSPFLQFAMIFSYCVIDLTLIKDLVGGFVFEIIYMLLKSSSMTFKIIAIIFILTLSAWLFFTSLERTKGGKIVLFISSTILICPMLLSIILSIRSQIFELTFFLPVTTFLFLQFIIWRTIIKKQPIIAK